MANKIASLYELSSSARNYNTLFPINTNNINQEVNAINEFIVNDKYIGDILISSNLTIRDNFVSVSSNIILNVDTYNMEKLNIIHDENIYDKTGLSIYSYNSTDNDILKISDIYSNNLLKINYANEKLQFNIFGNIKFTNSINNVTSNELNNLKNIRSDIKAQLDTKQGKIEFTGLNDNFVLIGMTNSISASIISESKLNSLKNINEELTILQQLDGKQNKITSTQPQQILINSSDGSIAVSGVSGDVISTKLSSIDTTKTIKEQLDSKMPKLLTNNNNVIVNTINQNTIEESSLTSNDLVYLVRDSFTDVSNLLDSKQNIIITDESQQKVLITANGGNISQSTVTKINIEQLNVTMPSDYLSQLNNKHPNLTLQNSSNVLYSSNGIITQTNIDVANIHNIDVPNIQNSLNSKQSKLPTSTVNNVLINLGANNIGRSEVTQTELESLTGIGDNIKTQFTNLQNNIDALTIADVQGTDSVSNELITNPRPARFYLNEALSYKSIDNDTDFDVDFQYTFDKMNNDIMENEEIIDMHITSNEKIVLMTSNTIYQYGIDNYELVRGSTPLIFNNDANDNIKTYTSNLEAGFYEILVVGGGGAPGDGISSIFISGGGGAGGVAYESIYKLPSGSYTINVGGGGSGSSSNKGGIGNDSSITYGGSGLTTFSFTGKGGGGGGCGISTTLNSGASGGSGGGHGNHIADTTTGTTNQGNTININDYSGGIVKNLTTLAGGTNGIRIPYTTPLIIKNGVTNQLPTLLNYMHYFIFNSTTGTNSITFYESVGCDILLIGGGGGGGWRAGAGGGAGGFLYNQSVMLSAGTYNITVGGGGAGGNNSNNKGTTGSNSTFSGSGITTLTAFGGGGGGGYNSLPGGDGGCGGGSVFSRAPGTGSQGYGGGRGSIYVYRGGGGGGCGGEGEYSGTDTSSTVGAGNGGVGRSCDITGTSIYYGGGGGGASPGGYPEGAGGNGGGGAGKTTVSGISGGENTGGGGGGQGDGNPSYAGGAGGSGVVIIRWWRRYNNVQSGGGVNFISDISGSSVTYATGGTGGVGDNNVTVTSNRGYGGSGDGYVASPSYTGRGGSGVVILRKYELKNNKSSVKNKLLSYTINNITFRDPINYNYLTDFSRIKNGTGTEEDKFTNLLTLYPTATNFNEVSKHIKITSGKNHAVFLTHEAKVFAFGNDHNFIGNNTYSYNYYYNPYMFYQIQYMNGSTVTNYLINIVDIACGSQHSLFLKYSSGNVYSCGYNTYGQLGYNNTTNQQIPKLVVGLGGASVTPSSILSKINRIYAGSDSSFFIQTSLQPQEYQYYAFIFTSSVSNTTNLTIRQLSLYNMNTTEICQLFPTKSFLNSVIKINDFQYKITYFNDNIPDFIVTSSRANESFGSTNNMLTLFRYLFDETDDTTNPPTTELIYSRTYTTDSFGYFIFDIGKTAILNGYIFRYTAGNVSYLPKMDNCIYGCTDNTGETWTQLINYTIANKTQSAGNVNTVYFEIKYNAQTDEVPYRMYKFVFNDVYNTSSKTTMQISRMKLVLKHSVKNHVINNAIYYTISGTTLTLNEPLLDNDEYNTSTLEYTYSIPLLSTSTTLTQKYKSYISTGTSGNINLFDGKVDKEFVEFPNCIIEYNLTTQKKSTARTDCTYQDDNYWFSINEGGTLKLEMYTTYIDSTDSNNNISAMYNISGANKFVVYNDTNMGVAYKNSNNEDIYYATNNTYGGISDNNGCYIVIDFKTTKNIKKITMTGTAKIYKISIMSLKSTVTQNDANFKTFTNTNWEFILENIIVTDYEKITLKDNVILWRSIFNLSYNACNKQYFAIHIKEIVNTGKLAIYFDGIRFFYQNTSFLTVNTTFTNFNAKTGSALTNNRHLLINMGKSIKIDKILIHPSHSNLNDQIGSFKLYGTSTETNYTSATFNESNWTEIAELCNYSKDNTPKVFNLTGEKLFVCGRNNKTQSGAYIETYSYAPYTTIPTANISKTTSATFVCNTILPIFDNVKECVLFELGDATTGTWIGFKVDTNNNKYFRFRVGGNTTYSAGSLVTTGNILGFDINVNDIILKNYMDGGKHKIVFEITIETGVNASIALYIDGQLIKKVVKGSILTNNRWANDNDGGFGIVSSTSFTSESTVKWQYELFGNLEYYNGANITFPTVARNFNEQYITTGENEIVDIKNIKCGKNHTSILCNDGNAYRIESSHINRITPKYLNSKYDFNYKIKAIHTNDMLESDYICY